MRVLAGSWIVEAKARLQRSHRISLTSSSMHRLCVLLLPSTPRKLHCPFPNRSSQPESNMLLDSGYPVMLFYEDNIPPSPRGDSSYGIMPSKMKHIGDLGSIIFGQQCLDTKAKVQSSLLVSFLQPSPDAVQAHVKGLEDPANTFHDLLSMSAIHPQNFWVEMHVTTATGHLLANLIMPAGMAEVAASKASQRDFTIIILGQALSWLYESSLKNVGIPGMRCAVPLAEVRVRDIVHYRHLKLAFENSKLHDIGVRGDSVEVPNRQNLDMQPLLAFCAVCKNLSTAHRRCGGCKVRCHLNLGQGFT